MKRLVLEIIGTLAGYAVFALAAVAIFKISKVNPHAAAPIGFMVASIISGMGFAFVGGYVANRIGGRRAAVGVAAIIALLAAVSMLLSPAWSPLAAILLMAPMAYLAGRRQSV